MARIHMPWHVIWGEVYEGRDPDVGDYAMLDPYELFEKETSNRACRFIVSIVSNRPWFTFEGPWQSLLDLMEELLQNSATFDHVLQNYAVPDCHGLTFEEWLACATSADERANLNRVTACSMWLRGMPAEIFKDWMKDNPSTAFVKTQDPVKSNIDTILHAVSHLTADERMKLANAIRELNK